MDIAPATRLELERVAREGLDHAFAGTISQADGLMELDASVYTDPAHFDDEVNRIFRRVPLMLATSCELARAGDYMTVESASVPVRSDSAGTGTPTRGWSRSRRATAGDMIALPTLPDPQDGHSTKPRRACVS